jgi:MSHA biogenesis protein MshP
MTYSPTMRQGGRGFALVPALFLLVVLGALAVIGIRIGAGQQHTVAMGLMQARALAAAQAGIEWGAYRALNGGCASATLTLTEASFNGFSVAVTCTSSAFVNGGGTNNAYTLTATATSGAYGNPDYVHRVVSSTLTDAT